MADGNGKSSFMNVLDASAKLLTPIVIFAVGTYYTWTKDAAEREQSVLDRCYGYAKDLSKAGVAEQKMLLGFIQLQCSDREELRAATLPQVVETAVVSKDAEIRSTATKTAETVASAANTQVSNNVQAALTTISRNIYIHIPDESRRESAENLKLQLGESLAKDSNGYTIPEIEVVGNDRSPPTLQLRYFRQEDELEARRLAGLIANAGLGTPQPLLTRGNARPGQLEIWFARKRTLIAPPILTAPAASPQ